MEDIECGVRVFVDVIDEWRIGDLRALFFSVGSECKPLGNTMKITGEHVTDYKIDPGKVQKISDDCNMNGDGGIHVYDVGVEFGTQGMAKDDIQKTKFDVVSDCKAEPGLKLSCFVGQEFGVRLTSVGYKGNSRGDSCKIAGVSGCCPYAK
jgi:hypothetical protein